MRRRTRIVATLGPATDPSDTLDAILRAGVDVARINFSHGDPESQLDRIQQFRDASRRLGRNTAVLADLPGPKLRALIEEPIELRAGDAVFFCFDEGAGSNGEIGLTEPEILYDVRMGQPILLDDGRLELEAGAFDGKKLRAKIRTGGTLKPNKGVNLPETRLSMPALTDRDRAALQVAAQARVDWIALSFVRGPDAANQLRNELRSLDIGHVPIIAKMERPEAVEESTAESIINRFDGIMVARGDLGVEIDLERVPNVQKTLIALARKAGKPVITATDMLDSMRLQPRPTRAEVSDVANAVYDGTDAVMLSGETAIGGYPVEAVQCMDRIAKEVEQRLRFSPLASSLETPQDPTDESLSDAITLATCQLAASVKADAILTPTNSGRTARMLARHRPWMRIVAPVPSEDVARRLALVWGLWPVKMPSQLDEGADRLTVALKAAFDAQAVSAGDLVVMLAGHPIEGAQHAPTVRVCRVRGDGGPVSPIKF